MNDDESADQQPHRPESVMIKLTRMEGKLDNLHDKLNDMRPRVDRHDVERGMKPDTSLPTGAAHDDLDR
jgi:hypothetical protein